MPSKTRLNALCLTLTPIFGLAAIYLLATHQYGWALLALFGIVACMETRVRLGYRSIRGAVFAVHLACASALILALILLMLEMQPLWSQPLAVVAFIGMAASGAVLIRRSWQPLV